MIQIRTFRNADLPILLELWIQHWSSLGPPPSVDAARLEQAILSRTFFDPAHLLLAENEQAVQAWVHFAPSPAADDDAVIGAICLSPSCDPAVADQLLESAEKKIAEQQARRILAGVIRDDQLGYAGLDPIGHGIGIPTGDIRTTALLEKHGYSPQLSVVRMIASARGYRPPINREALQFRRTSQVESVSHRPGDARHASAMSHLDVEQFRLLAPAPSGGEELARLSLWLSDAEAEVMRPSMAILDISRPHGRGRLKPAESYLVGTLVQSLAERRIDVIETAVDEEQSELVRQLEGLHFQIVEKGVRWEKSLQAKSDTKRS